MLFKLFYTSGHIFPTYTYVALDLSAYASISSRQSVSLII